VAYRPAHDCGDVWRSERLDLVNGWEGAGLIPTAMARQLDSGECAFAYDAYGPMPPEWETFPDWKQRLFVDGDELTLSGMRPVLTEYLRWLGTTAGDSGR